MSVQFVYAGVGFKSPRRAVVLCEHAGVLHGDVCGAVFRVCLARIPDFGPGQESMKSFRYENVTLHYRVDGQGLVVCVATRSSGERSQSSAVSAAFFNIDQIRSEFLGTYRDQTWRREHELELNEQWARVLQRYVESPLKTKLEDARVVVQEITDDMRENIRLVMQRGDAIDNVFAAADDLSVESTRLKFNAKELKDQVWWENKKYWVICMCITVVVVAVILLILVLAVKSPK